MSISMSRAFAAAIALALCAAPAGAQTKRVQSVASFHLGEEHLNLDVFRARDGSKLALVSIENPLRMRGLPTGSVVIWPEQWPAVIDLWTKARAGITGAEPWTTVGDVQEPYSPSGTRLSLSSGPTVRFSVQAQSAVGGISFELAPADLDAMGAALAREQKMLASKK